MCIDNQSVPAKEHNAIDSASFSLLFAEPLQTSSIDRIRGALDGLKDALPGAGPKSVQLAIQVPFGNQFQITEASRFKSGSDGKLLWRVHAAGNMLHVNCASYDNYEHVWQAARHYLLVALQAADMLPPVVEVAYQVVDRFTYPLGMDRTRYEASELYRTDSPYLTPQVWESGDLWHVFQGWFEHAEGGRTLHQVNVSNTEDEDLVLMSVIDHRAALRGLSNDMFAVEALIALDSAGKCQMDSVFDKLRASNMTVIKGLLNDDKLQKIGINTTLVGN